MNAPKVLHVVLKDDGITEVLVEDIKIGLIEAGCESTTVCLRNKKENISRTTVDHAIYLNISNRFRFIFEWLSLWKLSKILIGGDYNVVISHRYKPCILLMKLVRQFPSIEFVNVVHGTGHYNKKSRKQTIIRLAHERFKFVCVSDAVADFIRTQCGVGNTRSPIEVIPNGIDIQELDAQQLSKEDARKELGLDDRSFWVGFVGRLVRIKGIVELIQGFTQIAEKYPSAKLAIIGKGKLREELQAMIEERGLQDRIFLLGQVSFARRYLKAFDAFALPSYREGMSIALLEAMATGLPVLVSDIPMNTSVVDKSAVVFKTKSSGAVAEALDHFLGLEPERHAADGLKNRTLAEQKYDIRIFRRNYANLAHRLAAGSHTNISHLGCSGVWPTCEKPVVANFRGRFRQVLNCFIGYLQ